jgi:plastocyanin
MRRLTRLSPILLAAGILAGCGSDSARGPVAASCPPSPPPKRLAVKVVDNEYRPEVACVAPGGLVVWSFEGRLVHNVVAEGFRSELLRDGEFQHRFTTPGEYEYRCTIHAGMNGTVVVG